MPAAIRVNALTPPRAVAVGSTVNLSEAVGGWVSYDWALLDRPEGSAATITGPTTPTPTVVADTEGTYLISLTVDAGLTTVNRTTAIFYVARLLDGRRDPAAGETIEDNPGRGWAESANQILDDVADLRKDAGRMAGIINFNGASADFTMLYVAGTQVIKAGLPGESMLPVFAKALANNAATLKGNLYILERGVVNGASPVAGEVIWARVHGIAYSVPLTLAPLAAPIYLTDAGGVGLTAGTISKQVGQVVGVRLNECDIEFDGHRQGF